MNSADLLFFFIYAIGVATLVVWFFVVTNGG